MQGGMKWGTCRRTVSVRWMGPCTHSIVQMYRLSRGRRTVWGHLGAGWQRAVASAAELTLRHVPWMAQRRAAVTGPAVASISRHGCCCGLAWLRTPDAGAHGCAAGLAKWAAPTGVGG